jgi:predicted phosphoadenosine phosphosulfate sulfurtransferase
VISIDTKKKELIGDFAREGHTHTQVTVDILTGAYETGEKCTTDFIKNMRIVFDDYLPRWNYRAFPLSDLVREVIFG